MILLFDTNVLLSALFFKSGLSSAVLRHAITAYELVISDWILDEFTDKLNSVAFRKKNRSYVFDEQEIEQMTSFLNRAFSIVTPTNPLPKICRDPDDNHVLQGAEFAQAAYLITGDKDLLILDSFSACRIVSPRTFAELSRLL